MELKDKLNKTYISLRRKEFSLISYSAETMLTEINKTKPEGLIEQHWSEYIEECKKLLFSTISSDLESTSDPIKFLQSYDIEILDQEFKNRLQNRAYLFAIQSFGDLNRVKDAQKFTEMKRPDWMKTEDYDELYKKSKKTLELDFDIEKSTILLDIIKKLMAYFPLPKKKPDLISDEDWDTFIKMDNELRVQKQKNEELKSLLEQKEENISKLLNKVERQLEIIHVFLNDPSVLDRIEDYNEIFAPGNLKNLQKIAKLIFEQIGDRNRKIS